METTRFISDLQKKFRYAQPYKKAVINLSKIVILIFSVKGETVLQSEIKGWFVLYVKFIYICLKIDIII